MIPTETEAGNAAFGVPQFGTITDVVDAARRFELALRLSSWSRKSRVRGPMSKLFRLAFLVRSLLLAVAMCSFLHAQVERGTLSGTVRDSSGAIVTGVSVVVRNVNTGVAV